MERHLTRGFFEEELPGLAEAYGRELNVANVGTDLVLKNGLMLRIEGRPVCTDSYIAVTYKSGSQTNRAILPYGSIVGVTFAPDVKGQVGFHR